MASTGTPICDARDTTKGQASNDFDPIERLPPEIFLTIIEQALPTPQRFGQCRDRDYGIERYYRNLVKYILVSKQWRSFIEDTPVFWSIVSTRMPNEFILQCLSKSSTHPLFMHLVGENRHAAADQARDEARGAWDQPSPFSDLALHRHRCQSLVVLFGPDDWNKFKLTLDVADESQQLSSLTAICTEREFLVNFPRYPSAIISALRRISLRHVAVPWEPGILAGLLSLQLIEMEDDLGPPLEVLLDILRNSPDIEELKLLAVSIPFKPSSPQEDPFPLVHLRALAINGPRPEAGRRLFTSISTLPAYRSLECFFVPEEDVETRSYLDDTFGHLKLDLIRRFVAPASRTDHLPLRLNCRSTRTFDVGIGSDDFAFAFAMSDNDTVLQSGVNWFFTTLESHLKTLSFAVTADGSHLLKGAPSVLKALQQVDVETLRIISWDGTWGAWLDYLRNPGYDDSTKSVSWNFPKVTKLHLIDESETFLFSRYGRGILEMLRSRYGGPPAVEEGWTAVSPARLTSMEAMKPWDTPLDDDIMAQLVGILGEGVFTRAR